MKLLVVLRVPDCLRDRTIREEIEAVMAGTSPLRKGVITDITGRSEIKAVVS